ncbi:hypothetical protein SKAU_G00000270 [Synaphobranchus kaupii]|uniref:Uncharacterized protein n=1 Tax=Synaphobranchus kaupii TaxID=118154 RepID=A0A9Q1G833_SYNKA|nr:hypothetical protein SKAU_G00000270 [Synaphobranchus kaupii]
MAREETTIPKLTLEITVTIEGGREAEIGGSETEKPPRGQLDLGVSWDVCLLGIWGGKKGRRLTAGLCADDRLIHIFTGLDRRTVDGGLSSQQPFGLLSCPVGLRLKRGIGRPPVTAPEHLRRDVDGLPRGRRLSHLRPGSATSPSSSEVTGTC